MKRKSGLQKKISSIFDGIALDDLGDNLTSPAPNANSPSPNSEVSGESAPTSSTNNNIELEACIDINTPIVDPPDYSLTSEAIAPNQNEPDASVTAKSEIKSMMDESDQILEDIQDSSSQAIMQDEPSLETVDASDTSLDLEVQSSTETPVDFSEPQPEIKPDEKAFDLPSLNDLPDLSDFNELEEEPTKSLSDILEENNISIIEEPVEDIKQEANISFVSGKTDVSQRVKYSVDDNQEIDSIFGLRNQLQNKTDINTFESPQVSDSQEATNLNDSIDNSDIEIELETEPVSELKESLDISEPTNKVTDVDLPYIEDSPEHHETELNATASDIESEPEQDLSVTESEPVDENETTQSPELENNIDFSLDKDDPFALQSYDLDTPESTESETQLFEDLDPVNDVKSSKETSTDHTISNDDVSLDIPSDSQMPLDDLDTTTPVAEVYSSKPIQKIDSQEQTSETSAGITAIDMDFSIKPDANQNSNMSSSDDRENDDNELISLDQGQSNDIEQTPASSTESEKEKTKKPKKVKVTKQPTDRRQAIMAVFVVFLSIGFALAMAWAFMPTLFTGAPAKKVVQNEELEPLVARKTISDVWQTPRPYPKSLRDPMQRHVKSTVNTASLPNNNVSSNFKVDIKGAVYSNDKSSILVDQEILYEGDTYKGITVDKITRTQITFKANGKTWTQEY